jgi:hypothetical protein
MTKPTFFHHKGVFYNINQIVKFKTVSVTHFITFSTGEEIEVNTGHLDLKDIVLVTNPPYDEGYSKS